MGCNLSWYEFPAPSQWDRIKHRCMSIGMDDLDGKRSYNLLGSGKILVYMIFVTLNIFFSLHTRILFLCFFRKTQLLSCTISSHYNQIHTITHEASMKLLHMCARPILTLSLAHFSTPSNFCPHSLESSKSGYVCFT